MKKGGDIKSRGEDGKWHMLSTYMLLSRTSPNGSQEIEATNFHNGNFDRQLKKRRPMYFKREFLKAGL